VKLPTINYSRLQALALGNRLRVVDVRSPQEFSEDHIPNAQSIPLFDDDQRCLVGTLYKKESPQAAYNQGLEFASERMGEILNQVLGFSCDESDWRPRFRALIPQVHGLDVTDPEDFRLDNDNLTVVHCWRGGMRSRSLVALLQSLGHENVVCLAGGYKGYRGWVRHQLSCLSPETPLIVLRGPTGVGKTKILQQLEARTPGSTIDLEGCAGHRSSILGAVGLRPVSQKAFESSLVARLSMLGDPPWFVEGESRKVGDVIVPTQLFAAMEGGDQVHITASQEHRCNTLAEDYLATPGHIAQLRERLPFLEKRLGAKWIGKLQEWLDAGNWRQVAETLLEHYYDPLYGHTDSGREWSAQLNAEDSQLLSRLEEHRAVSSR